MTSDIPDTSNFVTTNTAQTISEDKTFTKNIYVTRDNEFHRFGTAYDGLVVNQPAISGKGTAYLEADKVGLYFGDPDTKTKNGELSFIEYWENDEGHTSSATANIHVASADQQTSSSVDIYLPTTSGTLALTSDIPDTSSFVSTTGDQYINGIKKFNSTPIFFDGLQIQSGGLSFQGTTKISASGNGVGIV